MGPARNPRARFRIVGAALICLALWCACGRDTRLSGKKLRTPSVRTVTHYGITLDPAATPEQVAFVALRAIRDDVQAKTPADRDAALERQFDVAAGNVIVAKNRTSVPDNEFLHNIVYHWATTISHYVGDVQTDFDKASARFRRGEPMARKDDKNPGLECEIAMQFADPEGDPNASVVMLIWLAQDGGYWRVTHLGFDPTRRTAGNKKAE